MDKIDIDLVVVGAGPGGYAAAFHAADHGKKVILVEKRERLGGVCLNCGCIPSKALLHATYVMEEAKKSSQRGIHFGDLKVDVDQLRSWKNGILENLSKGISQLAAARNVNVIYGRGHFEDSNTLRVETSEGQKFIRYKHALIATGSKSALPKAFDLGNPRIMTSTEALEVEEIPESFLVVGGGYIGMELGMVYSSLGSKVSVVEAMSDILFAADPDLVRPVKAAATKEFENIYTNTKVTDMSTKGSRIRVLMQPDAGEAREHFFDRVMVAVGRTPNCDDLGLDNTKVQTDAKGFIQVGNDMLTDDPSIYAIGDVAGGDLLAHKAAKEAQIAVESLLGENPLPREDMLVPAVVFTHPEIAWCGITEQQAKERGMEIKTAKYSWRASGRALSFDRPDGLTKLIVDPETERLIGAGIVGQGAGELISEAVLAIEMGATVYDLAQVIHPHPALSETIMEAALSFYGASAHVPPRKR